MKINTKSLLKKIALILAGVTAISAVGVGIAKLVEYTRQDLRTINPSFEVGNIGSDGKYVNDESTLYTKEAFAAEGLQIVPEFDSVVSYTIYFYDAVDNFISKTEELTEGYSNYIPSNSGYARIVITPLDDEDGKISLLELVSYPKNLNIKVSKSQDIDDYGEIIYTKSYLERNGNVYVLEGAGYIIESTGEFKEYDFPFYFSTEINASKYKYAVVKIDTDILSIPISDPDLEGGEEFPAVLVYIPSLVEDYEVVLEEDGYSYLLYDINYSSYLRICTSLDGTDSVELYLL